MKPEESPLFLLACKKFVEKYRKELDELEKESDNLMKIGIQRIKELAAKAELLSRGMEV